jgi:apolipoprotein N-acyltransferase
MRSAADAIMHQYLALSASMPASPSTPPYTLLIWPESAVPFFLSERPEALAAIAALLPTGTSLLTGAARRDGAAVPGAPAFNSVLALSEDGTVSATYDKVHLVPFGEYLPWPGLLEALGIRHLVAIEGGFAPGAGRPTLSTEGAPPFAPLICYEIVFPRPIAGPGERPAWLLNVTNDGWFGNTPGPYQHYLQARVRAVEEGLPLVRAANSGISAVVDAYGRERGSLAFDEVGVIDATLPTALTSTFYAAFGEVFLGVMLLLAFTVTILCKVYL